MNFKINHFFFSALMGKPGSFKAYTKPLFLLIFISTCIRIFFAFNLELGNDEVYYWTYSQNLQWNYFDHPPVIAWIIRVFTLNLWLQDYEGFLRLGSIVSAALSTYFMFRLTQEISSPRAGFMAALLYTASLYGSVIAGILLMPDSPQMVFWTLSLWFLIRIQARDGSLWDWIGFGIFSGLCIMSKVHGGFLWIGLGMYILGYKPQWLKTFKPYLAFVICLILVSPIIFWNVQNHFITYRFHSERIQIEGLRVNLLSFSREILGQIGYGNPILVGFSFLALWKRETLLRQSPFSESFKIMNWIAFPMIGTVLVISLFRFTLPHWAGPAYISLIPLTAYYFTSSPFLNTIPKRIYWALGLIPIFLISAFLVIEYYPGTLSPKRKESKAFFDSLGLDDITLDVSGWRASSQVFGEFIKSRMKTDHLSSPAPLIIDIWFPGSHLDYYFAHPYKIPVMGMGRENNLHQYIWSNTLKNGKFSLEIAYTVVITNHPINPLITFAPFYRKIERVGGIETHRGSWITGFKPARNFYIYRLSGYKGILPILQNGQVLGVPTVPF